MGGMGINPASGRFAATERSADTATALASDGAPNNARTTLKNQAVALQADAANMGRGLPSQATQALGLGVQTGNSIVGNNVSTNSARNQGVGILQPGYSTAMQGYGQQANILNNLYQNQLAGWKAEQSNVGVGFLLVPAQGPYLPLDSAFADVRFAPPSRTFRPPTERPKSGCPALSALRDHSEVENGKGWALNWWP